MSHICKEQTFFRLILIEHVLDGQSLLSNKIGSVWNSSTPYIRVPQPDPLHASIISSAQESEALLLTSSTYGRFASSIKRVGQSCLIVAAVSFMSNIQR